MRWQERIFPISSVNLSGSQEITANNEIAPVQSKTAWRVEDSSNTFIHKVLGLCHLTNMSGLFLSLGPIFIRGKHPLTNRGRAENLVDIFPL